MKIKGARSNSCLKVSVIPGQTRVTYRNIRVERRWFRTHRPSWRTSECSVRIPSGFFGSREEDVRLLEEAVGLVTCFEGYVDREEGSVGDEEEERLV